MKTQSVFALFSILLAFTLMSCSGSGKHHTSSTAPADNGTDTPTTWTTNTIAGKWLSDCVDLTNSGSNANRLFYVFTATAFEGYYYTYSSAQDCQNLTGGLYNTSGSQAISMYNGELSSSGSLQTASPGYFFAIEITSNQMDAIFWGSPTSQDKMILGDKQSNFLSNGVIDYPTLNSSFSTLLSQDWTQFTTSNVSQGFVILSRQPNAATPNDFGASN